jgi:hypothetical protein
MKNTLIGRAVTKQINNETSQVSFIIPENNVLKSSFIVEVNMAIKGLKNEFR